MRKTICFLLAILAFLQVSAQKLPAVQTASVKAPANIKIDGKATEWGEQVQAYNPTSRVFYTLSNDQNNLYLVARMEDFYGSDKALKAGITLTINAKKDSKTKTGNNIAVTFPIRGQFNEDAISDVLYLTRLEKFAKKIDSFRVVSNKRINASFKLIKVSGIKGITESSIPIYNNYQIQAAAQFNSEMKYVLELALPLKYLQDMIDPNGKLSYNLKINGTNTMLIIPDVSRLPPDSVYGMYPTDLSGEYTLAK